MKIMDFLNERAVSANITSTDKKGVISELVDLLLKAGVIKDKETVVKVLMERESLGSTGIGQGIGIPHGKCDCVKELVAAFWISQKGINFDALDGEPVYIFFLLLAPTESAGPHLKALARISRLLKDRYFRDMLKNAKDEKAIVRTIRQEDEKKQ